MRKTEVFHKVSKNKMNNVSKTNRPTFAFKRLILESHEQHEIRSSRKRKPLRYEMVSNQIGDAAFIYRSYYGTVSVPFLYIHKNMYELEKFEIGFMSEEGISRHKEFYVSIPEYDELGEFKYYVQTFNEEVLADFQITE